MFNNNKFLQRTRGDGLTRKAQVLGWTLILNVNLQQPEQEEV